LGQCYGEYQGNRKEECRSNSVPDGLAPLPYLAFLRAIGESRKGKENGTKS